MIRDSNSASLHPTARTFARDVLQSAHPVLVDFWAPWCPPCLALKPEVERLGSELQGRAKVAFINVDQEPELASLFRVNSIPMLMIIKNGQPVDSWTGYLPRSTMLARVQRHLMTPLA